MASVLRYFCLVVIALAALGGLALAWMPLETAVSHFVADDAFYYLTAARHLLAGHGPTLDGRHFTNGFHPLWMGVCVLLTALTGGAEAGTLQLALSAGLLAFGITLLLLFRVFSRSLPTAVTWALVTLLAANYRLASLALGGLETAVAGLLAVALVMRSAFHGPPACAREAIGFGALAGCAVLARFDQIPLAAAALAWTLLPDRPTPLAHRLKLTVVSGLAALLVLLPWFGFSLAYTGRWLPASGEAMSLWLQSPWAEVTTASEVPRAILRLLRQPAADTLAVLGLWPRAMAPRGAAGALPVAFCGVLVLATASLLWRCRADPVVRRIGYVPLATGFGFLYYCRFGVVSLRYLYPSFLLWLLLAACALGAWGARQWSPNPRLVLPLLLLGLGSTGASAADAWRLGVGPMGAYHQLHDDLLRAAQWLRRETPPGATLGSFNAGLLSYLSDRPTVDLDGVMNQDAIQVLRERRLIAYLDQVPVDYLVDFALVLDINLERFGGTPDAGRRFELVQSWRASYFGGSRERRLDVRRRCQGACAEATPPARVEAEP